MDGLGRPRRRRGSGAVAWRSVAVCFGLGKFYRPETAQAGSGGMDKDWYLLVKFPFLAGRGLQPPAGFGSLSLQRGRSC